MMNIYKLQFLTFIFNRGVILSLIINNNNQYIDIL